MSEKYRCGYCGAEYDTPLARARCELECDEKRRQELEKQRKLELHSTQRERAKEVKDALQTYKGLWQAYLRDYGESRSLEDVLGVFFR